MSTKTPRHSETKNGCEITVWPEAVTLIPDCWAWCAEDLHKLDVRESGGESGFDAALASAQEAAGRLSSARRAPC